MDINKALIEHLLYPAMETVKGNRIRAYMKRLKASQNLSPDQLQALQRRKLIELLKICVSSVPAYQDLDISIVQIESDPYEALSAIPPLSKKEFQKNPDGYLKAGADKSALIPNSTGGSTGQPVRFYMDRFDVENYEAARWRGLSWWGITPGSRSVMIWGNPIELDKNAQRKNRLKDRWLKNRIIISAYDLTSAQAGEYVDAINRFKPEYIYGYASALYGFANLLLQSGRLPDVKLKAVVSTAETLHDYQKETISRAFGCGAANEYGARDAGILAYSCPHGGMHLSYENAVLEIVDPITLKPLPNGERGLVLATDLNNFAMPRLRYILGDLASLSDKPCGCGLELPCIASIDGRQDDLYRLPDGTLVHGNFVNQLTRKRDSIAKFQLIQHTPDSATLNVVLKDGAESDVNEYIRDLEALLPGVSIGINVTDDIPPGKSGKFRYAIREFDL